MKPKKIPIFVCGFIGSGKSTLAKHLAKKYRMRYISGSYFHKQLAVERLHLEKSTSIAHGFWETKDGQKANAQRHGNTNIDKEVDRRLLRFLREHPNTVSDSRLMPWLYSGSALRVWLKVSEKERVRRVAARDGLSQTKTRKVIMKRYATEWKLYRTIYGIQFGEDFSPFDLVINTEKMTPRETFTIVTKWIEAQRAK